MIIWGSRGVESTVKSGQFNCPQCGCQRRFSHKRMTPYFTLYFIPIFPTGKGEDYILCGGCRGTFAPAVLRYDPEAERAKAMAAMLNAQLRCLIDLGLDGPPQLRALQEIFGDFAGREIDDEEIDARLSSVRKQPDTTKMMRRATKDLSDDAIWFTLLATRRVMHQTGIGEAAHREGLVGLGKAMGLRKKHIEEFLDAPLEDD